MLNRQCLLPTPALEYFWSVYVNCAVLVEREQSITTVHHPSTSFVFVHRLLSNLRARLHTSRSL